jgi:hypothetical protein
VEYVRVSSYNILAIPDSLLLYRLVTLTRDSLDDGVVRRALHGSRTLTDHGLAVSRRCRLISAVGRCSVM